MLDRLSLQNCFKSRRLFMLKKSQFNISGAVRVLLLSVFPVVAFASNDNGGPDDNDKHVPLSKKMKLTHDQQQNHDRPMFVSRGVVEPIPNEYFQLFADLTKIELENARREENIAELEKCVMSRISIFDMDYRFSKEEIERNLGVWKMEDETHLHHSWEEHLDQFMSWRSGVRLKKFPLLKREKIMSNYAQLLLEPNDGISDILSLLPPVEADMHLVPNDLDNADILKIHDELQVINHQPTLDEQDQSEMRSDLPVMMIPLGEDKFLIFAFEDENGGKKEEARDKPKDPGQVKAPNLAALILAALANSMPNDPQDANTNQPNSKKGKKKGRSAGTSLTPPLPQKQLKNQPPLQTPQATYTSSNSEFENDAMRLIQWNEVPQAIPCVVSNDPDITLDFTGHDLAAHLKEHVVGQNHAMDSLAALIHRHYLSVNLNEWYNDMRIMGKTHPFMEGFVPIKKSNVLIVGNTGSGKTLSMDVIEKYLHSIGLNVPVTKISAAPLTTTGYVGASASDMFVYAIQKANGDIAAVEKGIFFIDEIDKIAMVSEDTGRDIKGSAVQNELLDVIQGGETRVKLKKDNPFFPDEKEVILKTDNMLFIVAGAFKGMDSAERDFISDSKLEDFGFGKEFVGRFPHRVVFNTVNRDMILQILANPYESRILQAKQLYKIGYNISLDFGQDALEAIADRAILYSTGARGLQAIVERVINSKVPMPSFAAGSHISFSAEDVFAVIKEPEVSERSKRREEDEKEKAELKRERDEERAEKKKVKEAEKEKEARLLELSKHLYN